MESELTRGDRNYRTRLVLLCVRMNPEKKITVYIATLSRNKGPINVVVFINTNPAAVK